MVTKTFLLHNICQFWNGSDLGQAHQYRGRRERRMLLLGAVMMVVVAGGWAIFFVVKGQWLVAALDLIMVLSGVAVAIQTWLKQTQSAALVLFGILFTIICLIALIFDVPSPQAPRSTHFYLLPLSVGALMAFRKSNIWLRHSLAFTGLLAFVLLNLISYSPLPAYGLPENIRDIAWLQTTSALVIFQGMLYIMQNDALLRSSLEKELRHALANEEFLLYFQPQVDTKGRVIGAEALIRWNHPERGLVMPGQFIGFAEQTGLIVLIGLWVAKSACKQLEAWSTQAACRHLRLAINISQMQFSQPNFVPQIVGLIERFKIHPSRLELELTESMLVNDIEDIIQKMAALRAHRIPLSLDDFGTGYSSLNYLKKLPVDQLKIDQSFVRDLLTDANDASIARTVVILGHNLGLRVIAEGVETQEQRELLEAYGCDFFQGYLFSRPIPIAEFNALVQRQFESSSR